MATYELRMDMITYVEEERAIWDISDDDYRVAERKNSAWMSVMRKLKAKKHTCEMSDAERMWKSLRDTWKKNVTTKTGSAAEQPWIYMEALKFLESCEVSSPRLSNFTAAGTQSTFACSSQDDENIMDVEEEVMVLSSPSSNDDSAEHERGTLPRSPSRSPSRKLLGTPRMKKKRTALQENYNFLREAADAVKTRLTAEAPVQQPTDNSDHLWHFFTF